MSYPITLGILGGGQLAKMLANEAYKLGMNIAIIEKGANTPAGDMTKLDFTQGWENIDELNKFIAASSIITLENEFINPDVLEYIEKIKPVFPSSKTLKLVQDKLIQKTTFQNNNISVPIFQNVETVEDAYRFGEKHSYPFIIKSRKMGYDGYGNAKVEKREDIVPIFEKFKADKLRSEIYAEQFIDFKAELAIMIGRNQQGEMVNYPVVETIQRNHICNEVIAPADINESTRLKAIDLAKRCVESIDGVGIFGIELFLTKNDDVLVNEIAPRPHNTGHYTIDACVTSQFENAIRAVLGLPFGSTEMVKPYAVMINLLGERNGDGSPKNIANTLALKNVSLHLYNKKESRIGRKMGHITVIGDNPNETYQTAKKAKELFVW
ncbi:MAG: 5-(carboxyamino)imidazole ribonucleotide synthase [Candidatus Kapaibacteriota bacterium]